MFDGSVSILVLSCIRATFDRGSVTSRSRHGVQGTDELSVLDVAPVFLYCAVPWET